MIKQMAKEFILGTMDGIINANGKMICYMALKTKFCLISQIIKEISFLGKSMDKENSFGLMEAIMKGVGRTVKYQER